MVGPSDELLPLRGQGDAVVPPVQQQVPKAVLQIVNDLPQIGLGDKERLARPLRGVGAAFPGDGTCGGGEKNQARAAPLAPSGGKFL